MSKVYKTAAGQHLNMDQLRLVNEKGNCSWKFQN
jgi:hypothetical protein